MNYLIHVLKINSKQVSITVGMKPKSWKINEKWSKQKFKNEFKKKSYYKIYNPNNYETMINIFCNIIFDYITKNIAITC